MPAERAGVEPGGHFVVLFVGRRGFDGHRALLECADEIHEALLLALGIGLVLFAQARGQQRTDAAADQKVRDEVALEQAHGKGSHRLVACAGVRGRGHGFEDPKQRERGEWREQQLQWRQ